MNAWLKTSPFLAVGIYISGDSRACRSQPNLTPRWIGTQLRKGWRLLPITLGPAGLLPAALPALRRRPTINPRPGRQRPLPERPQAGPRRGGARRSRPPRRSASCRAARSGTTSRASTTPTGTAASPRCPSSALDQPAARARATSPASTPAPGPASRCSTTPGSTAPSAFTLPDLIWIARWDGVANTSTSYIREDGWRPGGRVKQYMGGHDETWGGVTSTSTATTSTSAAAGRAAGEALRRRPASTSRSYPALHPPAATTAAAGQGEGAAVPAQGAGLLRRQAQRHLHRHRSRPSRPGRPERGFHRRARLVAAELDHALRPGKNPVLKFGSAGPAVRRVQRALNAADPAHAAAGHRRLRRPTTRRCAPGSARSASTGLRRRRRRRPGAQAAGRQVTD